MSQTSAPKRHIIEVAGIGLDDELVTRRLYAVHVAPRRPRRPDGHDGTRLRKALVKRLLKQVKRLNGRPIVIGV